MHLRNEKKDSIVETDSSMGSNGSLKSKLVEAVITLFHLTFSLSFLLAESQIQDSSAFDKLLMSSDTVKLTSTPDRLKTIEVFSKSIYIVKFPILIILLSLLYSRLKN